jgi:hypothetical protein
VPAAGLGALTDHELLNAYLALQLACGRSHQTLSRRRQQWFCFLGRTLKVEIDLRGLPTPVAPYHAGDLPPGPAL